MSYQLMCDICGKPITTKDYKFYKIKERKCFWDNEWWEKIHAHRVCIENLIDNTNPESPVLDDVGDWLCPSCGAEVTASDNFCSYCGKRLKWD